MLVVEVVEVLIGAIDEDNDDDDVGLRVGLAHVLPFPVDLEIENPVVEFVIVGEEDKELYPDPILPTPGIIIGNGIGKGIRGPDLLIGDPNTLDDV